MYCTVLLFTVHHYTALHCIALRCIVLYSAVLHLVNLRKVEFCGLIQVKYLYFNSSCHVKLSYSLY